MRFSKPGKYNRELQKRNEQLREACAKSNEEICQTLGKVLGYPWFKDDLKNFPDATEETGVCVGDHVAETIAEEAAEHIVKLQRKYDEAFTGLLGSSRGECVDWGRRERQEEIDKLRKVAQEVVDMWNGKEGACVEIRVINELESVLENKIDKHLERTAEKVKKQKIITGRNWCPYHHNYFVENCHMCRR